jgi:hypothetical protein
MGSDEGIPTIQAVIHYPAACLGALLALVALAFAVNRMGLIVWLPWMDRHKRDRRGQKESSRSHEGVLEGAPVERSAAARIALRCGLVLGIACSACVAQEKSLTAPQADASAERSQNPDLLSFQDLVALASTAKPEGVLAARFYALLNTPFVHSEPVTADTQPHRPSVTGLGVVLRVGQWNIERGLNFDLIRAATPAASTMSFVVNDLQAQRFFKKLDYQSSVNLRTWVPSVGQVSGQDVIRHHFLASWSNDVLQHLHPP